MSKKWLHHLAGSLALYVGLALGLCSCRVYGYLLGYPVAPKAANYRYYDPKFAAHNAANLHTSHLKTSGFYYEPEAASQLIVSSSFGKANSETKMAKSFQYFKFNLDGSFHLVNVAVAMNEVPGLFMRISPIGYYKLAGDTAWLEARNIANKTGPTFGYVVLRRDSIQISLPGLSLGSAKHLHYHQ